jgi:uncharacterized coiled-coil protein SlyX
MAEITKEICEQILEHEYMPALSIEDWLLVKNMAQAWLAHEREMELLHTIDDAGLASIQDKAHIAIAEQTISELRQQVAEMRAEVEQLKDMLPAMPGLDREVVKSEREKEKPEKDLYWRLDNWEYCNDYYRD